MLIALKQCNSSTVWGILPDIFLVKPVCSYFFSPPFCILHDFTSLFFLPPSLPNTFVHEVGLHSLPSISISHSFVSAGRFSVQEGKDGCWCECTFMCFFFSTRCNKAVYWELPSCGNFVAFSVAIQEGDNSRATWCWHCGSWLKYWLNTDNKVMQSETNSEWSALLAVLLHHNFQQEVRHLNACHGKSGNPIDQWSPSASSSLVTLQSVHNGVKVWHITSLGEAIYFLILNFLFECYPICQRLWCAGTGVWNFLELKQLWYLLS